MHISTVQWRQQQQQQQRSIAKLNLLNKSLIVFCKPAHPVRRQGRPAFFLYRCTLFRRTHTVRLIQPIEIRIALDIRDNNKAII